MSNNQHRVAGQQVQAGNKRTHTVQIDLSHIDPEYVGTFKFHHPTIIERMQVGVAKSQMLGGLEGRVDTITDNIAHMAAMLGAVLDSHPTWFDVNNVYDYEVLDRVYDEYVQWYNSFRRPRETPNDAGDSQGQPE
ncbi:hypothetical protein D3C74_50780 [compost metagenome]